MNGARLVLDGSGRKLACNRPRVADAQGRESPVRMEVAAINRLALVVDDSNAGYPVRIDLTISDEHRINLGGWRGLTILSMQSWSTAEATSTWGLL